MKGLEKGSEKEYLEGDGLGPGEGAAGAGVVGDANGEAAVLTVGRQEILARALEIEDAPVERPVVRVAEHGAHGVVCQQTSNRKHPTGKSVQLQVDHHRRIHRNNAEREKREKISTQDPHNTFDAFRAALAGFFDWMLARGARTARLGRRLLHLIEFGRVAAR